MQGLNQRICQRCIHRLSRLSKCATQKRHLSSDWKAKDVRQFFLDYFCNKNSHEFVRSSSVIPGQNQGTYFTNAGMNQFKPIFLGTVPKGSELAKYKRVVNSQKCIRVGGKHNDLDDVGRDLTHHTFFEMLGSWSFGDYFKKEACRMSLDLLVNVYKLPRDKLYVTYFGGNTVLGIPPDTECREIWRELGVPEDHILAFGMEDNFWDMGDTGPCGPCTEIHFDHIGGRDASDLVNKGSPEVVEIWNLVFMQYNRLGPEKLVPLPCTHVDTGMGLERICAVLRGTMSNYNTDLFLPIFDIIQKETGGPVYTDQTGSHDVNGLDTAYRIIADHTRMATVCISDGLFPGRDQSEHRLRIVIYRALAQCHQILQSKPGLLGKLVNPIAESLGETYPEIAENARKVEEVLNVTEEKYLQSYNEGRKNMEKLKKKVPEISTLNGEYIKRLHDGYYGHTMSTELIEMIAPEFGLTVDREDLNTFLGLDHGVEMSHTEVHYPCFTAELLNTLANKNIPVTDDSQKYEYRRSSQGKYEFPSLDGTVICLVKDNNSLTESVSEGTEVGVIIDRTQFYAEKGGQMGDKGILRTPTGTVEVTDTQCSEDHVLHKGTVTHGHVDVNQPVQMEIDPVWREGCMRNHTATHLLNAALRQVLGSDVKQCGSAVACDKLTFSFSCWSAVTDQHLKLIEEIVNSTIQEKIPLHRQSVPLGHALEQDGMVYLDNVVYPSNVFTVSVEGSSNENCCTSREICGGTHVLNTGDLEDFCMKNIYGQATGRKTIVCITGDQVKKAKQSAEQVEMLYKELASAVKQGGQLQHCIDLQKQIYAALKLEIVPRLFKEEMLSKLNDVGLDINKNRNVEAFKQLTQDLTDALSDNDAYIVYQFNMKVLPKLNKMMKSLVITKPLMLVVETSNNTSTYIAFPKGQEAERSEMVSMFCDAVSARVFQTEVNYTAVKTKGHNTEKCLDLAHKLMQDRCKIDVANS